MRSTSPVDGVHVVGPLAPYAAGFIEVLRGRGYTELSVAGQLRLMNHASRWLANLGLSAVEFSPDRVAAFSRHRRELGFRGLRTERALGPLVEWLRAEGVLAALSYPEPVSPADCLLIRYRDFLDNERCVVPAVSVQWMRVAAAFLTAHEGLACGSGAVGAAEVSAFCTRELPHRSRSAAQTMAAALRTFLRFCHVEGFINAPLAQAVPSVAHRGYQGVPQGITADAVAKLLASCDVSSAHGKRDHAILLLLARLGLRAGEVARLGLEDINWHLGEIVVHGKGNRVERMPLPADVGAAIADYLSQGRPRTASRTVFVRVIAPWVALGPTGVTWVVYFACERAGVPRIGAHRLRHTAASGLLAAGASYGEVGQVLRHASLGATAIYAKVDLPALRPLAPAWPGGAA